MANTIKIKRSAVQGKAPAVGDLSLGELALNTYDGKLYTLKNSGTSSVVEIGGSAFTGYITENTGDGTFWNVVTQKDVGYAANQVPLNQYLGQLAFLDAYSPAGLRRTGGGSDDVVVSSGGLVGIGITNPAEKLSVVGNFSVAGVSLFTGDGTAANYALFARRDANNNSGIKLYGTSSGNFIYSESTSSNGKPLIIDSSQQENIFFRVGGATKAVIAPTGELVLANASTLTGTASQLLQVSGGAYFSGNVGIGITNPSGGVDIRTAPQWSTFNLGANLVIGGTRNNAIGILDSSNSNPWAISNNAGNLVISQMPALGNTTSPSAEKIRIDSTGNVGIGTTNPGAKLEVTGDITVSANSGSFRTIGAPISSNTTLLLQGGAVSGSGGNIELGRDGINYYDANAQVFRNLNASTEYGRFAATGEFLLGTATVTGTASQPLQVTGGAYVSGNLGVGVTNPSYKLDLQSSSNDVLSIKGGTNATFMVFDNNSLDDYKIGGVNVVAPFVVYNNTDSRYEMVFDGTGNVLIGSQTSTGTASQLLQVTGGAYFSGNVGIGSTAPGVALAVVGSIQAGTTTVFSTLGQDGGRNIEVGAGSTTLDTYIDFGGSATYTDHATRVIRIAGDNSNFNIINRGTGNLRIVTQDAGPIDFLTTNTFRHRITSDGIFLVGGAASATGTAPLQVTGNGYFSGNVGIGTTNPAYKLEVNGDIKVGELGTLWFSDVANSIEKIASTSGTIEIYADAEIRFFESDNNVQKFTFDVNSGIALINGTTASGTANLQVTGGGYFSGSVGIGITTTSAKLEAAESASTGTYPIRATNTSTANNTTKFVGYELYGYDTVGTGKRVAAVQAVPADSNWVSSAIAFSTRLSDTVSEKVRIDSAGNVGIGSTSPNATLVVNGSARFFTASQGDVTITHSAFVSTIKGATSVQLVLGSNNTDVIRINNSSQVGIGTTNPVATLQVKDTLTFETTTTTTTSTSQVAVDTFAAATFRSAKYQVQVTCPGQVATLGSITNGGTGYTAGTFNVTFSNSSGTGAGAQGTVVISNGTVGAVGVGTTGGTGYTAGDVLTASGGSGFQVAVGTVNGSGTILTFGTISAAGAGYTAGVGIGTTTLTLLGGTGTGATATATINDGVITSSTLLQQPTTGTGGTVFYAGSNYTTSTVLTIAKTDVTNTIITIADSGGVSVFTSLTAHGVGVNDIVRVSSTANGLTAGTDYYVITAPTSTTFTLGTASGVGTTFTNGTSLSVGFYRNSAIAGSTVAYLNAISAISTNYQVSDLMVLQNGVTADYVEYATMANGDVLGTFAADISSSNARLLFTPTYTTNTVKVARQAVTV